MPRVEDEAMNGCSSAEKASQEMRERPPYAERNATQFQDCRIDSENAFSATGTARVRVGTRPNKKCERS